MAKEKKEEARSEGNLATEKQKELIKALYTETGYKRQYNEIELNGIYNEEAQKHIDFLLGYKRSQINGGKNTENATGFNKIEFGMIYKLVWRYYAETRTGMPASQQSLKKLLLAEYEFYMEARAFVKSAVEKKAGK